MATSGKSKENDLGFLADPSLLISESKITSQTNLSEPPLPPPTGSSSNHSSPNTILGMVSDEHNVDPPHGNSHERKAQILKDFEKILGPSDVKLTLVGKDGYRVPMDVHGKVLSEKSGFFMEKMNCITENGVSKMVEIVDCDDLDVYIDTLLLMYTGDVKEKLMGENVNKVLALLKVSADIEFNEGVKSCLEHLNAIPWSEDEEKMVVCVLEKLHLPDDSTLRRVSYQATARRRTTNDTFVEILSKVLDATDDKSSRDMKFLILKLVSESGDYDVCKHKLNGLCRRYLNVLVSCVSQVNAGTEDGAGEIARAAGNMMWILNILMEKNMCDQFVQLWADQQELAKVPTIYRQELSKITAHICVGIAKGKILLDPELRSAFVSTWLDALYDDFGLMISSTSLLDLVDREVVEDGISQTISTLTLEQQRQLLMKWLDRFLKDGDACPDLQQAFVVWWRRAFI